MSELLDLAAESKKKGPELLLLLLLLGIGFLAFKGKETSGGTGTVVTPTGSISGVTLAHRPFRLR